MKVQNLKVWQSTRKLTKEIYKITKDFPENEQFGLSSQIRRATISIMSNIAEGYDRASKKEFIQFLTIARGSVTEVQTQLVISNDVGYIDDSDYKRMFNQTIEIHKMINGLIKSLQ